MEFAYPIAVSSSDWVLRSLDAIDGRLQTSLTLVVTATGVALGFLAGRVTQFHSRWFYSAMAAFAIFIFFGYNDKVRYFLRALRVLRLNLLSEVVVVCKVQCTKEISMSFQVLSCLKMSSERQL